MEMWKVSEDDGYFRGVFSTLDKAKEFAIMNSCSIKKKEFEKIDDAWCYHEFIIDKVEVDKTNKDTDYILTISRGYFGNISTIIMPVEEGFCEQTHDSLIIIDTSDERGKKLMTDIRISNKKRFTFDMEILVDMYCRLEDAMFKVDKDILETLFKDTLDGFRELGEI